MIRVALEAGFPSVRHMQAELTVDEVIELMNYDDQHGFRDRRFAWSNAVSIKYLMKRSRNYTPKAETFLAEMENIKWPQLETPHADLPDELRWKMEQDLFR